MKQFLERFLYGGKLAICVGSPDTPKYVSSVTDIDGLDLRDKDVFFGPAARRISSNLKTDVQGTKFLWVDADDPTKPLATLPPTMIVFSGHGWHLYWELATPLEDTDLIERLNKVLIDDVPTADKACWNVNRLLRVPGTTNNKDKAKPVAVELKIEGPHVYLPEDIVVLERLDKATKHKIRTGDSRGYRSRSERDWAIITSLLKANASDALIEHIFAIQPCGEKYRETAGKAYFTNTLAKAKTSRLATPTAPKGFEETEDGYLRYGQRGPRRVSTFVIAPKLLLDGSAFGAEDAIVGDVKAANYVWENITFTRGAFTGLAKLDKETPVAAWQWLGRDEDVRSLLPYLLEKLKESGLPRVAATPTLGLHKLKDEYFFLGDKDVIGSKTHWLGFDGPLAWLPSHKEHPVLSLTPTSEDLGRARTMLPLLNQAGVIWPMLGWYAAAPFKTWFEANGYRFPILSVVGTKGSGKTTLIQRVFLPLFGQMDPKSYDAGTTRFVTLALLGSSNGVPIAFSEFRYESVEKFIRFILLAYDTGHDPRGRGDQTTVDYPLSAPFSVDGEDLVDDPAARERIVVARLDPHTIDEGGVAYKTYKELSTNPPRVAGYYVQKVLGMLESGEAKELLDAARKAVFKQFPGKLPDRVRNNHIVAFTGVLLWCKVIKLEPPSPEVMEPSITCVYDMKAGRTRTMADYMIEDVVNAASQGTQSYQWTYDAKSGVLWFQLSSAHTWWVSARRRQGRGALERDAIKYQLQETSYVKPPQAIKNMWMYGVCLSEAQTAGLDIPSVLRTTEITIKF